MARSAHRSRKSSEFLIGWREAEYAMRRVNAADTCDDRVSENIFDIEDERAAVDLIARWVIQGAH